MSLTNFLFTSAAASVVLGFVFYYIVIGLCLRHLGSHLLRRTTPKRSLMLEKLGAGDKGRIVGFFHPYWSVMVPFRFRAASKPKKKPKIIDEKLHKAMLAVVVNVSSGLPSARSRTNTPIS